MDAKLIMFAQDGTRREFPIKRNVTTIGRKEDCDIRIPLAVVSRTHCEIVVEEDGLVLRDLGAANGTYLNDDDHRVLEEDLEPGDRISIGPVVFTVQIDGDPADDEIDEVRSRVSAAQSASGAAVGASRNVQVSDEDSDPISALEALASSADQTAINPEEDDQL